MEAEKLNRVIKVTIDISESDKGMIVFNFNDDPWAKSEEFVNEHKLDEKFKSKIAKLLEQQRNIVFGSKENTENGFFKRKHKKKSSLQMVTERIMKHSYRYSESANRINAKINYGHILFAKGLEMKEKIRQNSEKYIKHKETTLNSELTFRPTISQNSLKLMKSYQKCEKSKKNQELLQKLLSNKEEKELKDCYFVPSIINKRNSEVKKNVFSRLYNIGNKKNKPSPSLSKNNFSGSIFQQCDQKTLDIVDNMIERLSNSHKKTEENIELMRRDAEANYDKETGQRLFIPVILNNSQSIREERSVWDELYYKGVNKNSGARVSAQFNSFSH